MDFVQDALFIAFHPHEVDEEGPDERYLALWTLFLASVGWTDHEYWAEWQSRPHPCNDCGETHDEDDENLEVIPVKNGGSKSN